MYHIEGYSPALHTLVVLQLVLPTREVYVPNPGVPDTEHDAHVAKPAVAV